MSDRDWLEVVEDGSPKQGWDNVLTFSEYRAEAIETVLDQLHAGVDAALDEMDVQDLSERLHAHAEIEAAFRRNVLPTILANIDQAERRTAGEELH